MADHEFKVGDQVAHEYFGNGELISTREDSPYDLTLFVEFESGSKLWVNPKSMRPRNFLSKIAEEQEYPKTVGDMIKQSLAEKSDDLAFPSNILSDKTVDQQFNEVFKPERFQRNAYGQLVDTVTGLPADSEGLVQISSIRDSVRSIS